MVQSCAASSNHVPSQLFFTLSLCWLPRRQWSEVWEVEQWFGMSVFFLLLLFIYFISFLSLSTSWKWNITNWTNDCVFVILQVKEARLKCWAFPVEPAACMHACKRAVASQAPSPDPCCPTCSHHFPSLWSHNSWRDASALPHARNLSAATGKCVF